MTIYQTLKKSLIAAVAYASLGLMTGCNGDMKEVYSGDYKGSDLTIKINSSGDRIQIVKDEGWLNWGENRTWDLRYDGKVDRVHQICPVKKDRNSDNLYIDVNNLILEKYTHEPGFFWWEKQYSDLGNVVDAEFLAQQQGNAREIFAAKKDGILKQVSKY